MAARRRLTDDEVIQELDRQASEKQIKVDRARCVLALNRHDSAVVPVKRLLASLGFMENAVAESSCTKSAKAQRHDDRLKALQGARVMEKTSALGGGIPPRFQTLGSLTVPLLQVRATFLSPTLLSRGNLRDLGKKSPEGSAIAVGRLIEFMTGCGPSLLLDGVLRTWHGLDEYLKRSAIGRSNKWRLVQLPMLSYMHGLFKIAATIAESKIAITFVPSATTRELDISSCARAPTVLPQAIWRVESNWSEVLAAIHVSSDDSWELTCVTIFPEIVVGAATKGFDAICDGSARNSRGLDGAMDGQPKPKQLVLTTRSGGTSDVDTLSILDAPRANQLLEKGEGDEVDKKL